MSEKIKKVKAPAKAEKAVAKKVVAEKVAAEKPATKKKPAKKAETKTGIAIVKPVTHEEVAALARQFWAERGYKDGHHLDDWHRAELELRGKAS